MTEFGDYELERLLGRGGMAEVFLAHVRSGPHTGRQVALKRLSAQKAADPTYTDLFLGEADLSRYLVHPNIVQVFDAGAVQDIFYIAMEFVEGWDLGQVLGACAARKVALPIDTCCYIAHMVGNALHFAHTAKSLAGRLLGIVHCDVTPSNIFISKSGQVKLGDFGVARTRALGAAMETGLAGKPQYFAPELLLGEEASGATDVFALAVILYEMLAGQRPFEGRTYGEICDRIVSGKVEPPSKRRRGVSPVQEQVILRALRRRASAPSRLGAMVARVRGPQAERYDTAEAFSTALAATYDQKKGEPVSLAATLQALVSTPVVRP